MIKKKTHPKFNVPNYGAKGRSRVKERWRKQRGIDSKKAMKKKEAGASPSIGYKNAADVRFRRPDGSVEMLIHNEKELRDVIANKGEKAEVTIVFAHDLSSRKATLLHKIAESNGLRTAN